MQMMTFKNVSAGMHVAMAHDCANKIYRQKESKHYTLSNSYMFKSISISSDCAACLPHYHNKITYSRV